MIRKGLLERNICDSAEVNINANMPFVCPNCRSFGNYFTGGSIEISVGNMRPYLYLCRVCGYTWGVNNLYQTTKQEREEK